MHESTTARRSGHAMRRLLSFVAALCIIISDAPAAQGQPPPVTLVVTSAILNVRSGPGTNNRILGQLVCGQTVIAEARTADGAWYRIRFNGGYGFVSAQFAIPGGTCTSASPILAAGSVQTATVTSALLNVRSAPRLGSAVVGQLQRGDVITVITRTADGDWLEIAYGDGKAYLFAQHTSLGQPPTVTLSPTLPARADAAPRLILADYVMWYTPDVFDGSKTFDVPAAGPYHSDDPALIQRHVQLAQRACLDGFAAHWLGPKEPRTTQNFNALLAASSGSGLKHAVVLLANSLPGTTEQDLIDAVQFVLTQWASHPSYVKLDGRPVIFFEGMTRPWGDLAAARAGWERIRQATDPDRRAVWFAEGLSTAFNPLFDGLYVYRIDHRNSPRSWLKQPTYAARLRNVERQSGMRLYFADTIAPGFDDTRSPLVKSTDMRIPAPIFARDRGNGDYYRETFSVTPRTGGDLLLVKSFNEWIEGTAIEPGRTYGDLYLNLTCELGTAYRANSSAPTSRNP
ncbi:MAG: hypothetical protein D6709_06100 [Chloroflexi bacterium]|jgi:uncharacterized protein YraI|uniref:SH3b domain-containing protein n=1 Tax=Candidatus Thermofonsia Clade 3 bacterium TaxID=2364212 RepID=A0A2M8QBD0_9CHLR|nr:SH3 domain-containing protein [Candidatus Roseilinea sp. NK_OTU-006]PJF47099.1 MAG: hypothetical protein CUN48_10445 [Candidatus Thermofonsia Clade 3 bacterium]RMG64222.1 MAG: hypothetical protein D6709_06100 [Chloroflexota bacterium]